MDCSVMTHRYNQRCDGHGNTCNESSSVYHPYICSKRY